MKFHSYIQNVGCIITFPPFSLIIDFSVGQMIH